MGTCLFYACKKDATVSETTSGPTNVVLYLSGDPGFFDNIFIDIKWVEVSVDTCGKQGLKQMNGTMGITVLAQALNVYEDTTITGVESCMVVMLNQAEFSFIDDPGNRKTPLK